MKINFDSSVKRMFRENLLYIVAFIGLIGIFVSLTFIYIMQYQKTGIKLNSLKNELSEFSKKKELLDFKNQVIEDEVDLNYINGVLSQLIPAKEDYFSIIAALDKLSSQTNFIITSYNINIGSSTLGKLAIVVEGEGNPQVFLNFLNEYNFVGGRLITIDKIEFSQEVFTGAKVNIYVHSGKAKNTNLLDPPSEIDKELIERIMEKVQIDIKTEDTYFDEYPTKSNPF